MNQIKHKLEVLAFIAEKLNRENITWAVGGSLLLYLKGKAKDFHDIDIMVIEEDVQRLKHILLEFGRLQASPSDAKYRTRTFLEFIVDNTDIDILAGFVIVNNGKEYDCALKRDEICETATVNGEKIPLQSLERWKYYYTLMGREDRLNMI